MKSRVEADIFPIHGTPLYGIILHKGRASYVLADSQRTMCFCRSHEEAVEALRSLDLERVWARAEEEDRPMKWEQE
jgi:hypothetical protein